MVDFPGIITTRLKTAVNNLTFSLSAAVGIGDAIIYTTSTTGAPAAGSFHIGNEVIYYTGKAADRFTGCLKGQDGTVDAVHDTVAGGNEVVFGPEAHHVNNLNEEMIATQTKIGADSSAVTTTHDYKLSGVTSTAKAVSTAGTQTIAGVKTFDDTPKTDAIAEKTAAAGVTIDGILLKDDLNASNIVDKNTTQSLTYKRITKKIANYASTATATANIDECNVYILTAQAEALTIAAPTGTPTQAEGLIIRIKDNATARALTWNAIFRAGTDVALPTTTVVSKTMYCGFIYNSTDTKWDLLAFVDNI